ncbi:MAG: ABC transporter permease [Acidimicrobiales bacterium]
MSVGVTTRSGGPEAERESQMRRSIHDQPERAPGGGQTLRVARRSRFRLVGGYLVTVFLLATVIFALPRALPGDPLVALIDDTNLPDPAARQALVEAYGLDGTVGEQYLRYWVRLFHGDLGYSIHNSQPVSQLLRTNLPWTLLLTGAALTLSTVIAYRAGVAAAWRKGSSSDRAYQVASTILRAVPEYALGTGLVIVLGVIVRAFPISGGFTPFMDTAPLWSKALDTARHLVLPLTALTLGLLGSKFLIVRTMTIGVLGQDHMLAARAKGLPEDLQKRRHAGKAALLPYLNLVGMQAGIAVGGATFIQEVFAYPGLGRLMSTAVITRDYALIEGLREDLRERLFGEAA